MRHRNCRLSLDFPDSWAIPVGRSALGAPAGQFLSPGIPGMSAAVAGEYGERGCGAHSNPARRASASLMMAYRITPPTRVAKATAALDQACSILCMVHLTLNLP